MWPQELSCGLLSSLQLPVVGFARQFQPDQGSWHLMPLERPQDTPQDVAVSSVALKLFKVGLS